MKNGVNFKINNILHIYNVITRIERQFRLNRIEAFKPIFKLQKRMVSGPKKNFKNNGNIDYV
jgi:hypothetical protein